MNQCSDFSLKAESVSPLQNQQMDQNGGPCRPVKRFDLAAHRHSCRHGAITHCWHHGFNMPHFSFMAGKFSHTLGFVSERLLDLTRRPLLRQKVRMNSSYNAGFQSDVCSGSPQESEGHNGRSLHSFHPGTILREQSLQPRLPFFTHQTHKLNFSWNLSKISCSFVLLGFWQNFKRTYIRKFNIFLSSK